MALRRRACRARLLRALTLLTLASALAAAGVAEARTLTPSGALRQAVKHDRKARTCAKRSKRENRQARRLERKAGHHRSKKVRLLRKRARRHARCARRHRRAARRLRRLAATLARARVPRRAPIPLGAALSWSEVEADPALGDTFLGNFDQMTPENELKWDAVHPGLLTWQFTQADQMVDWARQHGKRVRGHTLIWANQNPAWLDTAAWSRETLLLAMRNHIRTTMEHFKGRIGEWDVVNEAIDENGGWTNNVWYRVIGPDYVDYAYRYAHDADPEARLYYNEQGLDQPDSARAQGVLALVRHLQGQGLRIDGVGMQSHVATTAHASETEVAGLMKRFRDMGVDVAITEMDVAIKDGATAGQRLEAQRAIYGDYARACRLSPNCTSFTTWGVSDKYSWLDQPEWAPLLFDGNMSPKPAFYDVRDWIQTP